MYQRDIKMNNLTKSTSLYWLVIIIAASVLFLSSLLVYSYAQDPKPLPVLLTHGYDSTAAVWKEWDVYLNFSQIPHQAVTFKENDECGSAKDHAIELKGKVDEFMKEMHTDKINIVAHSKGGLDTRIYLSNNITNDAVANFIMIGTPNKGSPVEDKFYPFDECRPAASDLLTTSKIAQSVESEKHNIHTSYYTISGIWEHDYIPNSSIDRNCLEPDFKWLTAQYVGKDLIIGSSDGLVPSWSSEIKSEYKPLGKTKNCHTKLLNYESFKLAEPILNQSFIRK
jgi:hypothetical protein